MLRLLLVDEGAAAGPGLWRRLARTARLDLVGSASTIEEARGLLQRASVDVVLVDSYSSPDDFGRCRELRALTDVPIVVLASIMTPQRWSEARRAGASAYVLKTIDTSALVRELERISDDHNG